MIGLFGDEPELAVCEEPRMRLAQHGSAALSDVARA